MEQWYFIETTSLLNALQRAHNGEHPDLLLLELYANSDEPAG